MFRSTPPRGRRPPPVAREAQTGGFDPRLRAGGDLHRRCAGVSRRQVSIHASAREATSADIYAHEHMSSFDPRLRAGGDPSSRSSSPSWRSFDPRLRAGGDLACRMSAARGLMFRSTPPLGRRRPATSQHSMPRRCFDPRLRAGGDRRRHILCPPSSSFDPRLRERYHIDDPPQPVRQRVLGRETERGQRLAATGRHGEREQARRQRGLAIRMVENRRA